MAGKLKGGGTHIGLLAEEDRVHEHEAHRRDREDQEDRHLHADLCWEVFGQQQGFLQRDYYYRLHRELPTGKCFT